LSALFLVANCEVLTRLNPNHLLAYHHKKQAQAIICALKHKITGPFEVDEINDGRASKLKRETDLSAAR